MMTRSHPGTPASSPKAYIPKPSVPGVPQFGCEHVQLLLTRGQDVAATTIQYYKMLLRTIFDADPVIAQTHRAGHDMTVTSLTPNYLCLQCPETLTAGDRSHHGKINKHMFYVESRNGSLFCEMCGDFIWDPALEELRIRKISSGNFSSSRKRKRDEIFVGGAKNESKQIVTHTTETRCQVRGLRGIYNMGATCFMSVILQSCIHNPLLRNYFLSERHPQGACGQDNCLSCDMDQLFQDFYSRDDTSGYLAHKILADSWQSQKSASFAALASHGEQDAHEYFQFLAEELHRTSRQDGKPPGSEDLPLDTDGSCDCIIHKTFYDKIEAFLELSLSISIPKKKKDEKLKIVDSVPTLQSCLEKEYKGSEDCEHNCPECSKMKASKTLSIRTLPNVLCVQFKRFEHHTRSNESYKITTKVQFPLQVNMLPFTSSAGSEDVSKNFQLARNCTYDLLSVVVHIGTLDSGHYISYSRVGNEWFKFDDHKVTLVSEAEVLGAEAFLLYYIIRSLS